jgi:RimJ/RimL family protein N-acetyltransferase
MIGAVPALRFARLTDVPLEDLVAHMSDPRLRAHMPLLTGNWGEAEARAFVAAKEAAWARDGLGHWAFLAGKRYVGWGGFQKEDAEWDFGLVLRPRDFGLGQRITHAALDFARADPRIPFGALHRIGAQSVGRQDHSGATFLKFRLDTPLINQRSQGEFP